MNHVLQRRAAALLHFVLLPALLSALLHGCAVAPYTGRSQLMLVPPQQEVSLGQQAAREVFSKEPVLRSGADVRLVRSIGRQLAGAVNRPDIPWEFHVIDKPGTINAFALPGGKVFVYTGLIRAAEGRNQLAVVLAHEMAHILARHGSERLSTILLAQMGQQAAMAALGDMSPAAMQAVATAFGLGAQFGVILPFSRQQEYEADYIGLLTIAQAGYDPRAAVGFWEMMMRRNRGMQLEYLSTHPSDANRIAAIRSRLPEALQHYRHK